MYVLGSSSFVLPEVPEDNLKSYLTLTLSNFNTEAKRNFSFHLDYFSIQNSATKHTDTFCAESMVFQTYVLSVRGKMHYNWTASVN